jgi:hypothetical protein
MLCVGTNFVACSCTIPSGFQPATGYTIMAECGQDGSPCPSDAGADTPVCEDPFGCDSDGGDGGGDASTGSDSGSDDAGGDASTEAGAEAGTDAGSGSGSGS